MENRIYGKKIDIDTNNTMSFYNQRAKTIEKREQVYTTVLLGDQDPDYSTRWDEYEKSYVIPRLSLDNNKTVLDLGCGMGRWADTLSDKCAYYYGVDFSAEMIEVARKKRRNNNCCFYNLSIVDALEDKRITCRNYDIIIVTGVAMYVNDEELLVCYNKLKKLVNRKTIIYFEESVGKKERLTLNHIWSDNLNDYYEAIYRTREEYLDFIRQSMEMVEFYEEGYMDLLDKKEQSETSHWYAIFRCEGS